MYIYIFSRIIYRKAPNNIKLLYGCLCLYIGIPKYLHNNHIIKDIVHKLDLEQNRRIYEILGKYFLKIVKVCRTNLHV